jgi:hypothetical protein
VNREWKFGGKCKVQGGEGRPSESNLSENSTTMAGVSRAFCVEFSRTGQNPGKYTAKNAGNGCKTAV